jgi:hypothetical protein
MTEFLTLVLVILLPTRTAITYHKNQLFAGLSLTTAHLMQTSQTSTLLPTAVIARIYVPALIIAIRVSSVPTNAA